MWWILGGTEDGRFRLVRAVPDFVRWSGQGGLEVHVQRLAGGGEESGHKKVGRACFAVTAGE